MRLLRLKLENFRQHQSSDIEFGLGMTAIVGQNGSGKTTILEAISFALYGEIRGKEESLRFLWAEGNKYLARLTFEFGGRRFEVERSSSDAYLKEISAEGKVWATGKRATTEACTRLIGLNHEQFANSFCAEQKCLAFLQFKSNSVRQQEVAKMLGYDRLKLAETLASDRKKEFASRRATLIGIQADPEQLQLAKIDAQSRVAESAALSKALMERMAKLEKELLPAQENAKLAKQWIATTQEMKVLAGNADGLKTNVATCDARVKALRKEADELESLKPLREEYQQVALALADMAKALEDLARREQLVKQLSARSTEKAQLQKQLDELDIPDPARLAASIANAIKIHADAEAQARKLLAQWSDDRRDAAKVAAAAKADARNLQQAFARTESLASKGICPECEQPITKDYRATVEAKRSEWQLAEEKAQKAIEQETLLTSKPTPLVKAEEQVALAQKAHNQAQAEDAAGRAILAKATLIEQQITATGAAMRKLEVERDEIKTQFDEAEKLRLESRRVELEPKHLRLQQLSAVPTHLKEAEAALIKATSEHDSARARYRSLEADRAVLPFKTQDEADAAMLHERTLLEDRRAADLESKHLKTIETGAKRELELAIQRIKEFEAIRKDLAKLEKEEAIHTVASKELRELRLNLNKALGPELEARASENLALLTNGRYQRIVLDKTFAPSLEDDGLVLKSVISGGEEDVVALALRLALSELIQEKKGHPLSLLILDEVFGSLDAERRQSVLERLSALKGRFDQILVISHVEEINQVADQCLFLTRDDERHSTRIDDVSPEANVELILGA
jgi:exonuclease SbcC